MTEIFNSEIIPVETELNIWNTELISTDKWDNLFYRGGMCSVDKIRCISPCRSCYESWFDVRYIDFHKNKIADLVLEGFLTNEIIEENKLANRRSLGDRFIYDTVLGCTANYVQVKCKNCDTKHLMVLGITETQPGLYGGQLQGMWRIKE